MWPTLLSGAVVAIVSGVVWYLRRPRLRLSAEPREPWCVQTPTNCPPGRNPVEWVTRGLANYYRVQVANHGMTAAKACHVQLAVIWYVERQVWKRLVGWQSVDLIWSGSPEVRTKDFSAGQSDFCDVGHVHSDFLQNNTISPTTVRVLFRDVPTPTQHGRFMLDLQMQFNAQPNAFERGHYIIELAVFSENAAPKRLNCDVWLSGQFAALGDGPPLAALLRQRANLPKENTLDSDVSPDGW